MMNGFILQENTSILISRNGKNIVQHFTQESGLDYFFVIGQKIILTNGFIKKTQKTPKAEIALAKKYRNDYLNREEI